MKIIDVSSQFNNCGLHTIVPYLVAFISPISLRQPTLKFPEVNTSENLVKQFKSTQGYRYFLASFAQYYKLEPNEVLPEKITRLLEKYSHPLELQVLLGPVLRLTLKCVLQNHADHKENLKNSFILMLNEYKQKLFSEYGETLSQDEESIILWLSTQYGEKDAGGFEELFIPNLALIAKILSNNYSTVPEALWQQAYINYYTYLCNPAHPIFLSMPQLELLCQSFNFDFKCYFQSSFSKGKIENSSNALATVKVVNQLGNHWQILAANDASWDFTKGLPSLLFLNGNKKNFQALLQESIIRECENLFMPVLKVAKTVAWEKKEKLIVCGKDSVNIEDIDILTIEEITVSSGNFQLKFIETEPAANQALKIGLRKLS